MICVRSNLCVSLIIRYACLCVREEIWSVHCNKQVCEICCECEGRVCAVGGSSALSDSSLPSALAPSLPPPPQAGPQVTYSPGGGGCRLGAWVGGICLGTGCWELGRAEMGLGVVAF